MTLYRKPEDHSRLMTVGLLLSLALIIAFGIYGLLEASRLKKTSAHFVEARVTRGAEIYTAQCAGCHGMQGEGGVGPALKDRKVLKNTLDQVFFSVIRSGIPNTQMPAWSVDFGGPLTDEDIRDVVALMRSWEDSAPEIQPVVFVANAERGALLFTSTCAVCHGENGMGLPNAPAINDPERLSKLTDDWYRNVINNGRPAKGMPTWGTVLSPNQIEDLVALISDWRKGLSVQPKFNVGELLDAAISNLEMHDIPNANIQLNRAIQASSGVFSDTLKNVAYLIEQGNLDSAIPILQSLRQNWPMSDAVNGGKLYAANCAVCHGEGGNGGVGLPLKSNAFIESSDNASLADFLSVGREGTAMVGFGDRLSNQELADLVAWLRQWQN